ncbi:PAS domain-containing protein [Streptomyces rochei]|uniref:PAS domain-containing protein n=1 Tax=Streptomyces rochei TaxID=1928 RepID=UPI00362E90FE
MERAQNGSPLDRQGSLPLKSRQRIDRRLRRVLSLPETLQPHEGLDHPEDAGAYVQWVMRPLGRPDGAIGGYPGGVCLILAHEGSSQGLIGTGQQKVGSVLTFALGRPHQLLEIRKDLCQLRADLGKAALVGERPYGVDFFLQLRQRLRRPGPHRT